MPTIEQERAHGRRVIARVSRALSAYHAEHGEEISWSELAQLLQWSATTKSNVSTGKRAPTVLELVIIAMRTGASVGWLAAEEGVMKSGAEPVKHPAPTAPDYPGELVPRGKKKAAKKVNQRKR